LYFCPLRSLFITLILLLAGIDAAADEVSIEDTIPSKQRIWLVGAGHATVWAGTFVALDKAWYADHPRQEFHLFNDWPEWQQMDKAGHIWTTYQLSRLSADVWRWSGLADKKAIWLGGLSGLAFQGIIEILDAHSEKWGFSLSDMGANVVGAGLFVGQALTWQDQRLEVKFSYYPYNYPDLLKPRANELFGASTPERILKD